jgi:acetyl esterase/lipase
MTKKLLFLVFVALVTVNFCLAQQKVIPLYNGSAPGSENWNWDESESDNNAWNTKIVYNVSKPSLTVFAPDPAIANGTSVVICPGGGFFALSINSEGYDVAKWLVKKGVTCFVLKYRLAHSLNNDPIKDFNESMTGLNKELQQRQMISVPLALADGKAAIAYLRSHATDLNINPDKIGIIGFSAGGSVTASTIFNYTKENKPNFAAPIYAYFPKEMQGAVGADAPPLFIAVASDDQLNLQSHSIDLYTKWNTSKKDAELHVYNQGGHGFGMRSQKLPSDTWIDRFADWLQVEGFLVK